MFATKEFIYCLSIAFLIMVFACQKSPGHKIVSQPIPFGEYRKELTLKYIREHYDRNAQDILIEPQVIVVHWSATPTLKSLYSTFAPDTLPYNRSGIKRGGKVNVSAHFAVDQDGTIYQLMSEKLMARHTIGLNRIAIGIENVGGPEWPLTEEQLHANVWLIRHLTKNYKNIRYLIGHYEYLNFRDTPLWQEIDPSYFTLKQDPGLEFMAKLRRQLKDLELLDQFK